MKKETKLTYISGISMSLLFSMVYYLVFAYYIPSNETIESTLYLNQVGLFASIDNANALQVELSDETEAYVYLYEDLYAVVSGVSKDLTIREENAVILKELGHSYVEKSFVVTDEVIKYVDNNEVEKALEMISNQD